MELRGSGKSVTAKVLCDKFMGLGLPVIMINGKIPRELDFVTFLSSIKQDFVLFVDEFEKVFMVNNDKKDDGSHTQETFLSYMDGACSQDNKTVFIFTANKDINDLFIDRPSRIRYSKKYIKIDPKIIDMVIQDRLINQKYAKDIKDNISVENINVDTLFAIIDDVNMHDIPFSEFRDVFNYSKPRYYYRLYNENFNEKAKCFMFKDVRCTISYNIYSDPVENFLTNIFLREESVIGAYSGNMTRCFYEKISFEEYQKAFYDTSRNQDLEFYESLGDKLDEDD